jgi:uncharacterized membrane-anchored protein YitT (DUF2179 family)
MKDKMLFWKTFRDYALILLGALLQALALRLFLIPALLTSGGVSGLAQIINFYFPRLPVGTLTFLGNLPLFILGWRYLGGKRFALRTAASLVGFSLFTDLLVFFLPENGITSDLVLNAIYGAVIMGIGLGLVYQGRGTSGGSDIIARMLNRYLSVPVSQSYLLVDGLIVAASGLAFGWDRALYGLVVIYASGLAAEGISEGSAAFRSAMIVTRFPQEISARITEELVRGATILPGTGAYTGESRPVVYCVLSRSEVHPLKAIVHEIDPEAFMVIGQAHEVLGEGFKPLKE